MEQKVALITGASSGFGLLTAVEMSAAGYRVVATMRNPDRRSKLDEALAARNPSTPIDVRQLDITDSAAIPRVIDEVVATHGRIDVLVNNAGFALAGFLEDISLDELRRQFDTNFFGHVAVTKAVLPVMRRQRSGHIIMIGSISGRCAPPVIGSYASSKWALEGWSEALRIETQALGIQVVMIEPGSYDTDIWTRNAQLGSFALHPDSPNHARGARFSEHVQKGIHRADPRQVAQLILRIAQTPHPKLRYVTGKDAKMQLILKNVLPWRRYEKLAAKFMKIDQAD
ncbi:oxidoreductase [Candidatus Korobacter versatilis]|nr:oxidoreductase [Candidatus Koribacter versatilis]